MVAEISDGEFRGRGECVPYPRYGESVDSVFEALEAMKGAVFSGLDRARIAAGDAARRRAQRARCAFWDLDAKRDDRRVADMAGIGAAAAAGHRLYAEPRYARADGRGGGAPSATGRC